MLTPAQLKSAMAKIQPTSLKNPAIDSDAMLLQNTMLEEIKKKYQDLDYAVTKFSVNSNRGIATANIEVKNLDKTITKNAGYCG